MAATEHSDRKSDVNGSQGVSPGKSLLRLLDARDWAVMSVSCIASCAAGAILPLVTVSILFRNHWLPSSF